MLQNEGVPIEYGVDLVTFYHPGFWGLSSEQDMVAWCVAHPREMWERMLDALAEAGVSRMEVTFPPLDFRSALTAYGPAEAVREAFGRRGVKVVSGFLNGTHWGTCSPEEAVADVRDYAGFLHALGADILVLGTPMTHGGPDSPVEPLDATGRQALLETLAANCDAVGASLAELGIRLAIHTESHSITVQHADIATIMDLTDPALVGLCPDSAHITLSGGDPVAIAREFADRVVISHWKDASGPFPADLVLDENVHAVHRRFMRPLGEGVVDFEGWAKVMSTTATAGVRLIELDAAPNPVADVVAARAFAEELPE
ncbi:sugar phosphate isomerase/epimerase family protein [Kineococcus sp. SYSU DK003]|uniref:sugar phosphate isomerase/epimerase family protein n=1 Tax=Kineococcus sp. SYSU DK003 TaxID=3383124 RepID=UPI003D7DB982